VIALNSGQTEFVVECQLSQTRAALPEDWIAEPAEKSRTSW